MSDETFIATVKAMRKAQKDYFRERSPQHLNVAKELERAVDKELERRERKDSQKEFADW